MPRCCAGVVPVLWLMHAQVMMLKDRLGNNEMTLEEAVSYAAGYVFLTRA